MSAPTALGAELDPTTAPYRHGAPLYLGAGWPGVLPLPEQAKTPPPTGYTGEDGADPSAEQVDQWRRHRGRGNIALRLPATVVGIDVDAYGDRTGAADLARLEAEHGALPATWVSTSRPGTVSGIRLYRLPAVELAGRDWRDVAPGIETIRRDHRYGAVWPSLHPEGRRYVWLAPDGTVADRVPTLDELPELPTAWLLEVLTRTGHERRDEPRPDWPATRAGDPHRVGATLAELIRTDWTRKLDELAGTGQGSRMRTLTGLTVWAGARAHLIDDDGAYVLDDPAGAMWDAAERCGLVADSGGGGGRLTVERTIRSGLEHGAERPYYPPALDHDPATVAARRELERQARHDGHADPYADDPTRDYPPPTDDHEAPVSNAEPAPVTDLAGKRKAKASKTPAPRPPAPGRADDGRAIVETHNRELRDVRDEMHAAIAATNTGAPRLFVRAGQLVAVDIDENARPVLVGLDADRAANAATNAARFVATTWNERTEKLTVRAVNPPRPALGAWLALGDWPAMPALVGLVEAPIFTDSGTIHTDPGYEPSTRLYHVATPGLRVPAVPDDPSTAAVRGAAALLLEVVEDFPFRSDADRANAVGFLVAAVIRPTIGGPAPLVVIDAPTPGTGKSLLTNTAAVLATGREAPMIQWPDDEDEARKVLTSALASGAGFVALDNADKAINSGRLSSALTATTWQDRILGTNTVAQFPIRASWVLNGNGIVLRGDLPRRAVWVRMDPPTARPWERTDFRHPELLAWVKANRSELLGAVFTLARAWHVTGRPPASAPVLGSFEGWCRTVAGILEVAGIPGFLANAADRFEAGDTEAEDWRALLTALANRYAGEPFTSSAVAGLVVDRADSDSEDWADLIPLALAAFANKGPVMFARRLGEAFRAVDGRRWDSDGLRLVNTGRKTRQGVAQWRVARDNFAGGIA